ncbi:MAG: cobyric acid synthase [Fusobacteriaceae bacterium]
MRKHKNLMVVGTSSGAGKSLTVAGLARIFYKDGFTTVPFKSQNMALNSFITTEGHEMGRAQVVQAIACGLEPQSFMNPILLKPTGDRKSQVIVNGKSIGNMAWMEYSEFKSTLKGDIIDLYNKNIRDRFDVCIMEGAGSPVEINLVDDDIVNMGMAEMVDAPVILVADIDRGGVFASVLGTVMLMPENERAMLKGVIINKFRGDIEVLRPGLKKLEELTGIPVIGILPYAELDIEDEDGLSAKFKKDKTKSPISLSIIKNKRISNFNDFDPFNIYEDVSVNYVTNASQIGDEDMIILPGSKNTIEDLKDLHERGIIEAIIRASRKGTPIIGICGGLQMLGEKIKDPHMIESSIAEIPGMGLLSVDTIMEKEKNTKQYSGKLQNMSGFFSNLEGIEVKGYEIHQGITTWSNGQSITAISEGNIFATYVHGIFDNKEFIDRVLNNLREKKGLKKVESSISFNEYREKELDKLENLLRENIMLDKLYELMEINL